MRAVVHDRYGPPEVLRLEDVERPVPEDDEVLVRIHATTVNRTDCGLRSADPFFTRFFTGLRRPRRRILGMELAGEVEAVGAAVTEFEVGDAGLRRQRLRAHTRSTSASARARALAHKPAGMTFEEAAAVSDGACIALGVPARRRTSGKGRSVLVYGASGSIGTAAVQLAKHFERPRHRRVQHEERRARAIARSRRGHRLRAARTSRRTARPTTSSSTRSASTRSGAAGAR